MVEYNWIVNGQYVDELPESIDVHKEWMWTGIEIKTKGRVFLSRGSYFSATDNPQLNISRYAYATLEDGYEIHYLIPNDMLDDFNNIKITSSYEPKPDRVEPIVHKSIWEKLFG